MDSVVEKYTQKLPQIFQTKEWQEPFAQMKMSQDVPELATVLKAILEIFQVIDPV